MASRPRPDLQEAFDDLERQYTARLCPGGGGPSDGDDDDGDDDGDDDDDRLAVACMAAVRRAYRRLSVALARLDPELDLAGPALICRDGSLISEEFDITREPVGDDDEDDEDEDDEGEDDEGEDDEEDELDELLYALEEYLEEHPASRAARLLNRSVSCLYSWMRGDNTPSAASRRALRRVFG
jgi:hypothetical protein